jgi:insulysin
LIGHEGENSLLSLLIKNELAMELSAGGSDNVDLFHDFDVTIKLTKKGLE